MWLLTLVAVACSSPGAGAAPDPARTVADTLVTSADPALAALASEVLEDLVARSGLDLERPVRVEWRSREELEGYLRFKVNEELDDELAANITRAYAALGLVPDTLDLRHLLLSLYGEQVAGFYEPDSTALFILEDQQDGLLRTVMAHELVHAIQDQVTDLDSITARERGTDRLTAAQAAIEGHATLIMMEYMMEQMRGEPVDLSELPDLSTRLEPLLQMVRSQYPELAAAPRVIQESLLYPYLEGAGFVLQLWTRAGERVAPFGPLLPQSTEQVANPALLSGPDADPPTALRMEAERAVDYEDELGFLGTRIFLEDAVGAGSANGWDGDRFLLFLEGGRVSLAWGTVWDSAEARDQFVDAVAASAWAGRAGAEVDVMDADGRPGALVRVGDPPTVEVRLAPPG